MLTEIQTSIITKVKTVQLQLKKEARNKLRNMIKELDKLNTELETTEDQATRDRMLEAREAFWSALATAPAEASAVAKVAIKIA